MRKKIRGRWIKRIGYAILVLLLSAGIWGVGWSGIFAIKTVSCRVDGDKECQAEIIAELNQYIGKNLLSIRRGEIEERIISADRLAKEVKAGLKLPAGLEVTIIQRRAAAAITSAESFAEAVTVDSEGVILGKTDDPAGLPRLVWPSISAWPIEERLPENIVGAIILGSLAGERFRLEGLISIDSEATAVMRLATGEKVLLSLDKEPVEQLTRLQLVLNQVRIGDRPIREIDFRFERPVVR